jgi:hypothetical protein
MNDQIVDHKLDRKLEFNDHEMSNYIQTTFM